MFRSIRFVLLSLLFVGCVKSGGFPSDVLDIRDYTTWLDKESGLVQERQINGLKIELRYIPSELQAYREVAGKSYSKYQKDSLVHFYSQTMTFVITVKPADGYRDMMPVGEEFERSLRLGFENSTTLTVDKQKYRPQLTLVENISDLNQGYHLFAIYPINREQASDSFDFQWNDNIFTTGIHHLQFTKTEIDKIPHLKF